MSEAPAELWLRPNARRHWYQTAFPDEPDAVRYVRADLYDKRMVEPVNQEPWDVEYQAAERNPR